MSQIFKPRLLILFLFTSIIFLPYKFCFHNLLSLVGIIWISINAIVLFLAYMFYKKYASYTIELANDMIFLHKNKIISYSVDNCYLNNTWLVCDKKYIFLNIYSKKLSQELEKKVVLKETTLKEEFLIVKVLGIFHPIYFISLFLIGTSLVLYISQ